MPLSIPPIIDKEGHKPKVIFKELGYPNVCAPIIIAFD
jgi:hypothetical protein